MNVLLEQLIWMNKDAFSGFPFTSRVSIRCSTHFHLTWDWSTERTPGHGQKFASIDVSELNFGVSMPAVAVADDFPVVSSVTFAWLIAIGWNFLIIAQRTLEGVWVEVFACGHVLKSDDFSALDLLSASANFSSRAFDYPMRVHIIGSLDSSHRLLAASSSVLYVVRVQSTPIIGVNQLQNASTCHIVGFSGWNQLLIKNMNQPIAIDHIKNCFYLQGCRDSPEPAAEFQSLSTFSSFLMKGFTDLSLSYT